MFFFVTPPDYSCRTYERLWDFGLVIAFFILVVTDYRMTRSISSKSLLIQFNAIVVFSFLFGLIIEGLQTWFGRTAAWQDVGFNVVGAIFGWMYISSDFKHY